MQRINWIDWAKAIAVVSVVFCHFPQSQELFYYRYLQAVTISVFFFLSGYLKRDRGSMQENWRKYWTGLIAPYIIYNMVVYPFWIVKFRMMNGAMPDMLTAMKPIVGALLFEHEGSFAEPLNGPLWYLPAVLFMHLLTDLCHRTRHEHLLLTSACIVSLFLYAANLQWEFMHSLTPMGIFRRLPYFYIGYVIGQRSLFRSIRPQRDALCCIAGIALSLLLFDWHLSETRLWPHVLLFYPVNLCLIFGLFCGCKLLDRLALEVIVNLSVGTLVIIGLHYPAITCLNFAISFLTHQPSPIAYHFYSALPSALLITALLYPVIIIGKNRAPALLGKKKK